MNLNDFDITTHSGLYISKDEHPIFGKKYIARFQYDKKRYVIVLGYEKRDKITSTIVEILLFWTGKSISNPYTFLRHFIQ